MYMVWIVILGDFLAQTPILDFQLCETTSSGFQTIRIPSQVSSLNLKGGILRLGVEVFTIRAVRSMTRRLRMSITRIILGRGLPCKVCIWRGEVRIGGTVSNVESLDEHQH